MTSLTATFNQAQALHGVRDVLPHALSRAYDVLVLDCFVDGGMLVLVGAGARRAVDAFIGLGDACADVLGNEIDESSDIRIVTRASDRPVELKICVD